MRAFGRCFLLVVLPGLGATLAGCAAESAPSAPVRILASPEDIRGNATLLRILVITDEYLPVSEARVNVVGLGLNATTSPFGEVFFEIHRPGRYAVHAHHARFYPNETKVVVESGVETTARIRLRDAPGHTHFSDFYIYEGVCGPVVFVQGIQPDAYCPHTPYARRPYARWLLGPGLVRGLVYLEWSTSPASPARMRVEMRFPDSGPLADGSPFLAAEGPSPLRLELPEALITSAMKPNGNAVEVRAGLPLSGAVAVNAYQSFSILAQFDYYLDAPDVDPEI